VDVRFAEVLRRLMLVARGLGFVVLVYFLPVVLRDAPALAGMDSWMDLFGDDPPSPVLPLAIVCATFALSVGAVLAYRRAGDAANDPLPLVRADKSWAKEWAGGVLIGLGAATVAVLPALVTGAMRIEGFASGRLDVLAALILVLGLESAREELGFRGPSQRDLANAVPFPLAAVFLAGSFTLLHAGNPDVGRQGLLGIFFAGLALAGLVRARGDVAMACGAHAGWNWSLALLWSVPVSGLSTPSALLDVALDDAPLWTGGSFGAEASVPGLVVLAAAGFLTWRLTARSGPKGEGAGAPPPEELPPNL
jgi:hypothetical protein